MSVIPYSPLQAFRTAERLHPPASVLSSVFEAFGREGIRYCLLRNYAQISIPVDRELDLLVEGGQMGRVEEILSALGFLRLPCLGHWPHHFFVTYDAGQGCWLKLDLITELAFGSPVCFLRTGLEEECLRDRVVQGPTFVPSPRHEFLSLLLHVLLNKGEIHPAYRLRLASLWRQVRGNGALQKWICRHWLPALNWHYLDQAIERRCWQALEARRPSLVRQLWRRQPFASTLRLAVQTIQRKLQPLLRSRREWGGVVVLLGPDGAGKSSLGAALAEAPFLRGRVIYMGRNRQRTRLPFRPSRQKAWRPLLSLFRLLDHWWRCAEAQFHRRKGGWVIYDRHFYDGWLTRRSVGFKARIKGMLRLEPLHPKPDLVLLLDAPGKILYARKGEHSPLVLERKRRQYLALRKYLPNLVVIDARRPWEEVRRAALREIWSDLLRRRLLPLSEKRTVFSPVVDESL